MSLDNKRQNLPEILRATPPAYNASEETDLLISPLHRLMSIFRANMELRLQEREDADMTKAIPNTPLIEIDRNPSI